jgi:hypothetical protein
MTARSEAAPGWLVSCDRKNQHAARRKRRRRSVRGDWMFEWALMSLLALLLPKPRTRK